MSGQTEVLDQTSNSIRDDGPDHDQDARGDCGDEGRRATQDGSHGETSPGARRDGDDGDEKDDGEGASGLEGAWIASRERIRRWTRASTHPRILV